MRLLPPVFLPQSLGRLLEDRARSLEVWSSVVKVIELAVPLQDLVDVVPHDPHHLLDLDTGLPLTVSSTTDIIPASECSPVDHFYPCSVLQLNWNFSQLKNWTDWNSYLWKTAVKSLIWKSQYLQSISKYSVMKHFDLNILKWCAWRKNLQFLSSGDLLSWRLWTTSYCGDCVNCELEVTGPLITCNFSLTHSDSY